MKKKDLEIPFCDEGMCHPRHYYGNAGRTFYYKKAEQWEDRLFYVGILKGRSMLQFEFKSFRTGLRYFFLTKDFNQLMQRGVVGATIVDDKVRTSITGKFEFVKRGSSYGVRYVDLGL